MKIAPHVVAEWHADTQIPDFIYLWNSPGNKFSGDQLHSCNRIRLCEHAGICIPVPFAKEISRISFKVDGRTSGIFGCLFFGLFDNRSAE